MNNSSPSLEEESDILPVPDVLHHPNKSFWFPSSFQVNFLEGGVMSPRKRDTLA